MQLTPQQMIERGFYIFPVNQRLTLNLKTNKMERKPRVKWGKESSNDLAKIQKWMQEFPGCWWGIDCGKSGLTVLDDDQGKKPIAIETLAALEAENGQLPATYIVKTKSGGYHYYFRGLTANSVEKKLGPGLDTRSVGGFVYAPATAGSNYSVYQDDPIVDVPSWLAGMIGERVQRIANTSAAPRIPLDLPHNVERARQHLADVQPAIEGNGGGDHTFWVAVRARDFGIAKETCLDLMLEDGGFNSRCVPEWSAEELEDIVDHAYEYAHKEIGNDSPEFVFSPFVDPSPEPALAWVNADDYIRDDPPPIDPVLCGSFEKGDKVVVIGSSKLKKSFFLLQASLSMATGRKFLAWDIPSPRRVLYCQFEIKEKHFHARTHRLAKALGLETTGGNLCIVNGRGKGLRGIQGIAKIQKIAVEFKPDILALDPLYKIMDGAENDSKDMGAILSAFDNLVETTGAALIYVHHDTKGTPGDRDLRDRGSGSGVMARDYDASIILTKHATEPDCTVVEGLTRNFKDPDPFTALWVENERGHYQFTECKEIAPEKMTSKNRPKSSPLNCYWESARQILANGEVEIKEFRAKFKELTNLGEKRITDFIKTMVSENRISRREERGFKKHESFLKIHEM